MSAASVSEDLIPGILRVRRRAAKRLTRAREAAGLTLSEAAAISGIYRSRWIRFERAEAPIPLELIPLLAKAVNTNAAELVAA